MRDQRVVVIVVTAVTAPAVVFVAAAVAKTSKASKALSFPARCTGRLSEANRLDLYEEGNPHSHRQGLSGHAYPARDQAAQRRLVHRDRRAPGTTTFPARYPTGVALTSPRGPEAGPAWMAGGTRHPTGSGKLKFTKTGDSISLVLSLPESMEATKAEKVGGNWSCS
jgi:hypothetical protein